MSNNENQYYIYLRSTKERIPCTKEEFELYYRDINAFRKKQQRHGTRQKYPRSPKQTKMKHPMKIRRYRHNGE